LRDGAPSHHTSQKTHGHQGWLARLLESRDEVHSSAEILEASGLNFGTAIEVHQEWKVRLQAVIESRSQETLDPNVVCRDDQCELGRWIHGEGGRQFDDEPQFADLRRKHAYFHACAGRVVLLAQSGHKDRAIAEISPGGDFAQASWEVIGDLASMFTRLRDV
jgi:methyl-accepting chemotaxis protein